MKKKEQLILRQFADSHILVPVGETTRKFNGLITLNETAAFIWSHIEEVNSAEEMAAKLFDEFEVTEEKAKADAEAFIGKLKEAGFIE